MHCIRSRAIALAICTTSLVLGLALGANAQAQARPIERADRYVTDDFSLTMVSEGDSVGAGRAVELNEANSELELFESLRGVRLSADGSSSWDFSFTAPARANRLKVGWYGNAARFPSGAQPGMDMSSDHRGCNEVDGHFDVRVLDRSANARIERLWLLYEARCDGDLATFGEIRIGMSGPAVRATPSSVRWPDHTRVNEVGRMVPVHFSNGSAGQVAVQTVEMTGPGSRHFEIVYDTCSEGSVSEDGCVVWVRFAPESDGPSDAALEVGHDAGTSSVSLAGATVPGTTTWTLQSDPGDFIGQGGQLDFGTDRDRITFEGTGTRVSTSVVTSDGERWSAVLAAPQGASLVPGTYLDAHRYPFHGTGPGLNVSGDGRGCNRLTGQFTIHDIGFDAAGELTRIDASVEQHCESQDPALSGRLTYNAREDVVAPATVTGLVSDRTRHGLWVGWSRAGSDVTTVTARWYPGDVRAPQLPTAGRPAFSGTGNAFLLRRAPRKAPVTLAIFTTDAGGNTGRPQVAVIPPAGTAVAAERAATHG